MSLLRKNLRRPDRQEILQRCLPDGLFQRTENKGEQGNPDVFPGTEKKSNILKRLKSKKEYRLISEETLLLNGFLFDYHTFYFTSESQKNVFTFCYDYGYQEVSEKKYKIIRRW